MSKEKKKIGMGDGFKRAGEAYKALDHKDFEDAQKRGQNLTEFFESVDPSTDYDARLPLDAFDRVLLSQGIVPVRNPAGVQPSRLEDLLPKQGDWRSRAVAGEFFARQARRVAFADDHRALVNEHTRYLGATDSVLGTFARPFAYTVPKLPDLEAAIPLSELVSRTEPIEGDFVKPWVMNDVDADEVRNLVGEGANIPHVEITDKEKEITLPKDGFGILATYEKLRRIPLDILAIMLQRIAVKRETKKVEKVIDVLVSGDGNAGTAATNYDKTALQGGAAGDALKIDAWLAFKMKFKNPHMLTHVFASEADALTLFLLNSGSANFPLAQAGTIIAGQQFVPINKSLADGTRVGWVDNAPANTLVGVDARSTIVRYVEIGSEITEVATWVEKQMQALYMTENEAFEVWEPEGNKTLTLDA